MILRPYQLHLLDRVRDAYRSGARAVVAVMPTGAGKTAMFCEALRLLVARGGTGLVLVHRHELLWQTSRALDRAGVPHDVIATSVPPTQAVRVASVQMLARRIADGRNDPNWAPDLIVIDEAHHALPDNSWGRVISAYPDAYLLGLTATPERLDGRGLGVDAGGFFDALVLGPDVSTLTADGWLTPARVYGAPRPLDLRGIRTRAGDYDVHALAELVDRPKLIGDAVAEYQKHCPGAPAIAFCVTVTHARHVAACFEAAGWRAACIDGSLGHKERARLLAGLESGEIQVLTSCELISEGMDVPSVTAAILLRPTKSLTVYLQQVGRALRPAQGKDYAVVLDHAGNAHFHGLPDEPRLWSLAGKAARKNITTRQPIQCPECYAYHTPAPKCPYCGHAYNTNSQDEKIPQAKEGSLVLLSKVKRRHELYREQARCQSLEDLIALARARGYRRPLGWALHVWNARMHRSRSQP